MKESIEAKKVTETGGERGIKWLPCLRGEERLQCRNQKRYP